MSLQERAVRLRDQEAEQRAMREEEDRAAEERGAAGERATQEAERRAVQAAEDRAAEVRAAAQVTLYQIFLVFILS